DAFSDAYATFLLAEILPNVQDSYLITDDPDQWAIGGGSSGGSCAVTVVWTRPGRFRRVPSLLGRLAPIPGGDRYPEPHPATPDRRPTRPLRDGMRSTLSQVDGATRAARAPVLGDGSQPNCLRNRPSGDRSGAGA